MSNASATAEYDGAAKREYWNDGTFEREASDKALQTRARQHDSGHNNHWARDLSRTGRGIGHVYGLGARGGGGRRLGRRGRGVGVSTLQ